MAQCCNTRIQASNESIIRHTIRTLQLQCYEHKSGSGKIRAFISLYKYFLTCTDFIKTHKVFRDMVDEKSYEFLEQIPIELERIQDNGDTDHEDNLIELQDIVGEYIHTMME